MRALESMREKLKATGLYTIAENSAVDCELQAYAAALDTAQDALAELEHESFAATALEYGISMRETLFGITGSGTAEERRAAVLKLGAVTPNDFSGAAMARILGITGLQTEICENTAANRLYVNCLGSTDETARKKALKIANMFLPAHLNAELDFRSISWNNIDGKDDPFDAWDILDLTWDAIDHYESALLTI
jgi:hypothetical protein